MKRISKRNLALIRLAGEQLALGNNRVADTALKQMTTPKKRKRTRRTVNEPAYTHEHYRR
jgi:hypothetical protein